MGQRLVNRREFLATAASGSLLLGRALLFHDPLDSLLGSTASAATPAATGAAQAAAITGPAMASPAGPAPLDQLLRQAPVARFWVSTAQPGVACSVCHDDADRARRGIAAGATAHQHAAASVKCLLCARGCTLREGQRGECRVRLNQQGSLRSLVYGRPVAIHVDPIEKKPFFHFLPGTQAYSMATAGCPLHCDFCQNWEISQARPEDCGAQWTAPQDIASAAAEQGVPVIAFTYNEPTVFGEYLIDIAQAARRWGIRCVMVSCGYATESALTALCAELDAIKVDLKGFSPAFYDKVCHADLQPVLRSIRQVARSGRHLELVNLVVPTLNDSEAMLRDLAHWVVGELGPDVPVHFTRFHPDYKLRNLPPTPVATLERARAIAMDAGMRYAYVGNVPGHPGEHTYCPRCGKVVIGRASMFVQELHLRDGTCGFCGASIAGVFN